MSYNSQSRNHGNNDIAHETITSFVSERGNLIFLPNLNLEGPRFY